MIIYVYIYKQIFISIYMYIHIFIYYQHRNQSGGSNFKNPPGKSLVLVGGGINMSVYNIYIYTSISVYEFIDRSFRLYAFIYIYVYIYRNIHICV
jgi:hypothetical protein